MARTVRFARSEGRPIAVRGGGHSVAGFSTCDDGIVLDLAQLNDVHVDAKSRRAFAGGGTRWKDFDAATQQHGLATTGGLVSSTGIGGLTLGGGFGHLVRKYGLTCDNLLSVELVTADGSVVHASESQNPELFWALRGGGGNFGVVTSFELALHPVGPIVLGGPIFYPGDQAIDVMTGWRDQLHNMPDELSTLVNLTTAPPAPFIPEEWHNRKVAVVVACWAGDPADGEAVVKPLRSLGTPITDLLGPMPYLDLQQFVDPVWEAGAGNFYTSAFLDRLPDEAIRTLADFHRSSADLPVLAELHVHHFGGAVARVPAGSTAFTDRSSPFLFNGAARTSDPADLPQHVAWARTARNAMAAYGRGRNVCQLHQRGRRRHSPCQLSTRDLRPPASCQGSIRPVQRIPIQHKRLAHQLKQPNATNSSILRLARPHTAPITGLHAQRRRKVMRSSSVRRANNPRHFVAQRVPKVTGMELWRLCRMKRGV